MPQWKLVRLELARTPEHPAGSASRAYMLRVPLNDEGFIDEASLTRNPRMATVRRFWPNEADQSGYLVRKGDGWAFSYVLGENDDEAGCELESHPIRLGDYVTLTEPDGRCLCFRVVDTQPAGVGTA